MQRYRETHDFTHTLLQLRPNMLGEVIMWNSKLYTILSFKGNDQVFRGTSTRLPDVHQRCHLWRNSIGTQVGISLPILERILIFWFRHRKQLVELNLPWIVEQAQNSRLLLALDWERHFERRIDELQKECGIQPLVGPNGTIGSEWFTQENDENNEQSPEFTQWF